MELWIRVQKNKELKQGLCKVDDLFVEKNVEDGWIIRQCCDTLGIYKTEERALEILDEIQSMLIKNQPHVLTYTDGNIVNIDGNLVYEMPEE